MEGLIWRRSKSAGKHKRKKKDQTGKIHDKYDELRKNVRGINFVRRTKKTSAPHFWLRLECCH